MKQSLARTLVLIVLATAMVGLAVSPVAATTTGQWAKPATAAPDWSVSTAGSVSAAGLISAAADTEVELTSLTNYGRLGAEEMAWYGVWLFPGQRLDLSAASAADLLLVVVNDTDELAYADDGYSGTEAISFNYSDFVTGPQVVWIGVGAWDAGTYTLRVAMTDPPVGSSLQRVSGADRYTTSVKASQTAFATGADTVVIATGANFPDALAAAGLCGACDAPLLLVPPTGLPAVVSSEIDRLGATRAIVIGGDNAVPPAIKSALEAKPALAGNVSRIAGATRYQTARLVAEAMRVEVGAPLLDAIVVCGSNYADALSASPLAYAALRPILLTQTQYAHSEVLDAMDAVGVEDVTIVGGTGVVGVTAEAQIETKLGRQTQRLSGSSRFDTARAVAENSVAIGALSREFIGYASGAGFADGLSGGIACGRMGGVLLLTHAWVEPEAVELFNLESAGVTTSARVFGGSAAVWGNVLGMIDADLGF